MAPSVVVYAVPTVPLGREVVLIARVGAAMLAVSVTVLVCTGDPESCTLKVREAPLTTAVGVPEITPVAAARESPAGKVPAVMVHEKGGVPPLADRAAV